MYQKQFAFEEVSEKLTLNLDLFFSVMVNEVISLIFNNR